MPLLSEKNSKSLTNHTNDTVALGITQNLKKCVLPAGKTAIFDISAQIEETETTGIGKFQTKTSKFQYAGGLKKTIIFGKMN